MRGHGVKLLLEPVARKTYMQIRSEFLVVKERGKPLQKEFGITHLVKLTSKETVISEN